MCVPVTLLFLVWVNFATSSPPLNRNEDENKFVWLQNYSVGGIGNDGFVETELEEGETVTIRESLSDPSDKLMIDPQLMYMPVPSHQKVQAQTINPPTAAEDDEINSVVIREWLSHTTPVASSETTETANSLSAPWQDAVIAGLPAALAYDWRFLINIAAKCGFLNHAGKMSTFEKIYFLNFKCRQFFPTLKHYSEN